MNLKFWNRKKHVHTAMVAGLSSANSSRESVPFAYMPDVTPTFPVEIIPLIRHMAMVTPDISQAVKRMINLGNTGIDWSLEGSSKRTNDLAVMEIERWLDSHPGIINALLRQIIIGGALSAEAVPDIKTRTLQQILIIPPEKIRFKKVVENGVPKFAPYQMTQDGLTRLNDLQYMYEALERDDDSPYGIPLFISAWYSVQNQNAINGNFRDIIRKWGLLGFMHAAMDIPERDYSAHQTEDEYISYVNKTLENVYKGFEKKKDSGFLVTSKDIEIKHSSVTQDGRGFSDIFRVNEEQLASGLDIDPSLLGRSYSTTETYAGVVYSSFIKKLGNVRHPVKRFLEFAFDQHLRSLGYRFERVHGTWGDDLSHDPSSDAAAKKSKEEARQIEIANAFNLVRGGIITPDDAAVMLGFQKAADPEALLQPITDPANEDDGNDNSGSAGSASNSAGHPAVSDGRPKFQLITGKK